MDTLQEKALELRREYQRKWRKANPRKNQEYTANYWLRKAEQELEAESNSKEGEK